MKTITLNENELNLIYGALSDKAFQNAQLIMKLKAYEDLQDKLEYYKKELKEMEELLIKLKK